MSEENKIPEKEIEKVVGGASDNNIHLEPAPKAPIELGGGCVACPECSNDGEKVILDIQNECGTYSYQGSMITGFDFDCPRCNRRFIKNYPGDWYFFFK